jgi:hypothetical protein
MLLEAVRIHERYRVVLPGVGIHDVGSSSILVATKDRQSVPIG